MPSSKSTKSAPQKYLVDTCIFVHAFCEGINNLPDAIEASSLQNTIEASRQLFKRAETGNLKIFVSAVTVAEVLAINYLRRDDPRKPASARRRNDERTNLKKWLQAYTITVEIDQSLAFEAGDAGQEHLFKGADALIYASALDAEVDALITTDKGLLKANSLKLRVIKPTQIEMQTILPIN